MLQKNSFLVPSDTSGVFLIKVIQTRRCSTRKHAKTGKFLRVVIKKTKPKLIRRRKRRMRGIVIRSSHRFLRRDGLVFFFEKNAAVILKRRMNTLAKDTLGPTSKELKIKKFRKSIVYVY